MENSNRIAIITSTVHSTCKSIDSFYLSVSGEDLFQSYSHDTFPIWRWENEFLSWKAKPDDFPLQHLQTAIVKHFLPHARLEVRELFAFHVPLAHTFCSIIERQVWHFGHKLTAGRATGWEIIPLSCSLCRETEKLALLAKIIRRKISNSWDAKRCNPHFEFVAKK